MSMNKKVDKDIILHSLKPFMKGPVLPKSTQLLTQVHEMSASMLDYIHTHFSCLSSSFSKPFQDLCETASKMKGKVGSTCSHMDIALLRAAFNACLEKMRSSLIHELKDEHIAAVRGFSAQLTSVMSNELRVYRAEIDEQQAAAMPNSLMLNVGFAEQFINCTIDPEYYTAHAEELGAFNELHIIYMDDDRSKRISLEKPLMTMGELMASVIDDEFISIVVVRLSVQDADPDCLVVHLVSSVNMTAQLQANVNEARNYGAVVVGV